MNSSSARRLCCMLAVLVVTVLVASSAALGAPAEALGRVTAIEVQGNVRIDSDTIINKMSIKIGDQLVEKAVDESFAAIDSLGWFADLGANTVPYLGGIKLIVLVREFPVISRVTISGNKLIGTEELLGLMTTKTDSQLNSNKLRSDLEAIGNHYQEKGHWASIEPSLSEDGELTLHLVEWTVAEVKISGNEKTKPQVIWRAIQTKSGDYINVNKINEDRRKIYLLGAFENVEVTVEPVQGRYEYVVNYVLTERKTGIANLSLTYSSADGLMGFIELGDQNFLGNAQTVNIKAEFAKGKSNYELGFYEPWVGKTGKTSLGFNVFSKSSEKSFTPELQEGEEQPDPIKYAESRTGGDVTVGHTLSLNTKAFLKFKMDNAVTRAINPDQQGSIPEGGITRSLTASAVNDTRDDLWNPTSGHRLTGSIEYAGGVLGGDYNFTKVEGEGSAYYQVRDGHVLAGRISSGFGVTALPEQERFRLGGAETVRGYKYGDMQGDRMALANAEYRFRITKGLQGVVFCDAGQAWNAEDAFTLQNTKIGYGVGVRVSVPVLGLIRIDYGIAEGRGQAYFSFGQTF
ncbi:MAG TPA: BamA/TamA family outer membrane protein [Bacillota bacterium]|nr:BamA/TamA family outer membrane protein [Bacillota bacterium]